MLGCVRGFYALGARKEGPRPEVFGQIDPAIRMPVNSSVMGVLICSFWLLYLYGADLAEVGWFGPFGFDSSELPIISIYIFYIPIFFMIMKKERNWGVFKRFIMPALSICGCVFMLIAAAVSHKRDAAFYLIFFAMVMLLGALLGRKKNSVV